MALRSQVNTDCFWNGIFQAATLVPSAGCVTNAHVASDAAIDASKVVQQYTQVYSQNSNVASAAERKVIHYAIGAGTLVSFGAGTRTLCTSNAAITVALLKNGSAVLSASIVLDSANVAYIVEAGSLSSDTYVAADVFEVNVTVAAGAGALGNGVFCVLNTREAAE